MMLSVTKLIGTMLFTIAVSIVFIIIMLSRCSSIPAELAQCIHSYWFMILALFVIGVVVFFIDELTTMTEKFQHPSTHRVVLQDNKGGYIPGMNNDMGAFTPQEIPKTHDTPYENDSKYIPVIPRELYEGFEGEEEIEKVQESIMELPDNETPVTTMTQPDIEDSVVIPRVIKALPNKRNRGQGDPIRGDLAIMPEPCGWFRPSASPNIDLRQGALNIIAGEDNEQGKALTNLINSTSGSMYIGGKEIDEPQLKVESSDAIYAV